MPLVQLFSANQSSNVPPRLSGKSVNLTKTYLSLNNPWVTDSVFMGKMYTAMMAALALLMYPRLLATPLAESLSRDLFFLTTDIIAPFIFAPFLAYRIYFIKNLSEFYFERRSKKVYYRRGRKLITFSWSEVSGGLFSRREFGGSYYTYSYALAFGPIRKDGSLHRNDCLWVDSNQPTEPDARYVAEVWEYLRRFMEHGPDNLPPPGEPNWWHRPLHAICLTPAQAWRHYVPWRTGEPGEIQGKKNWQLPFWAVLFPYNFSLAVCWFIVCRVFNVKAPPIPPEVLVLQ